MDEEVSTSDAHTEQPETAEKPPALTDEQIETDWLQVKSCWLRHFHDADRIDTWLAAVVARAKREEREAAAENLERWATGFGPVTEANAANVLTTAASLIRHDVTNWPSQGGHR